MWCKIMLQEKLNFYLKLILINLNYKLLQILIQLKQIKISFFSFSLRYYVVGSGL